MKAFFQGALDLNQKHQKIGILLSEVVAIAVVSSLNSISVLASNEVKLVTPDQVTQCKKLGVYRGTAEQSGFFGFSKADPLEELEKKAMENLMEEAQEDDATHIVQGYTYRVADDRREGRFKFVFQFGMAYDCTPTHP